MQGPPGRSPLIPLARIATLVALGDLLTKQVALLWVGSLEPRVTGVLRFGVVHNDKGAFGLTGGSAVKLGNYAVSSKTLATKVFNAMNCSSREIARISRPAALIGGVRGAP